jgi:hypothetical protein
MKATIEFELPEDFGSEIDRDEMPELLRYMLVSEALNWKKVDDLTVKVSKATP